MRTWATITDRASARRIAARVWQASRDHGQVAVLIARERKPRTGRPIIVYWYERGYSKILERYHDMLVGVFRYGAHSGTGDIFQAIVTYLQEDNPCLNNRP